MTLSQYVDSLRGKHVPVHRRGGQVKGDGADGPGGVHNLQEAGVSRYYITEEFLP